MGILGLSTFIIPLAWDFGIYCLPPNRSDVWNVDMNTSPAILWTGKMLIDAHTHLDMYEEDLESALEEVVQHRIFAISNSMNLPKL